MPLRTESHEMLTNSSRNSSNRVHQQSYKGVAHGVIFESICTFVNSSASKFV